MIRATSASLARRGHAARATRATLRSRLLRTAKRGESTSDDAGCTNDDHGVYALCDGATRSFLPGEWAQILAQHVGEKGLPPRAADVRAWLEEARRRWDHCRSKVASGDRWWTSTPGRSGAATLFAIGFEEAAGTDDRPFVAVMYGDTCGFHVRDGRLLGEGMPCRSSSDFSLHPDCLMSIPPRREPELHYKEGVARPGDAFFLATDALAKWILTRVEAGESPWTTLLALDTEKRLAAFADAERSANRMDEDDVSLLIVELAAESDGDGAETPGEAAPDPIETSGSTPPRSDVAPARAAAPRPAQPEAESSPRPSAPHRLAGAQSTARTARMAVWSPPPPRHRVASTIVDAAPAEVALPGAEPPQHSRRRVGWGERLVWSVIVPAIVSTLASAGWSLVLFPDRWSRLMDSVRGASQGAPSASPTSRPVPQAPNAVPPSNSTAGRSAPSPHHSKHVDWVQIEPQDAP